MPLATQLRLTERVRNALALAEAEAKALGCERVETAALLVGLALEENGAAAQILERHDVTAERIRDALKPPAEGVGAPPGRVPFAPASRHVLERADAESHVLGHHYIGTEHVLLALALVPDGEAYDLLRRFGLDAEAIRDGVQRVESRRGSSAGAERDDARTAIAAWLRNVGAVPDADVERLLKIAATSALDQGRYEFAARDLLVAFLRDARLGPVLAGLGASEPAVLAALDRP